MKFTAHWASFLYFDYIFTYKKNRNLVDMKTKYLSGKNSHFPQSGSHLPTHEFCILIFVHNGDFEICVVTSFSQIYRKYSDSGKNKFAYFMMCYTLLCSS